MCALYARAAADVRAARRSGGAAHTSVQTKKAPLYRPAREAGARMHLGFPDQCGSKKGLLKLQPTPALSYRC